MIFNTQKSLFTLFLPWISILLLSGCISSVKLGHQYQRAGQHPLALEYYALHLQNHPSDSEARRAFQSTFLQYSRYLRKQIEAYTKKKQSFPALQLITELMEYALWFNQQKSLASGLSLDMKALHTQMKGLIKTFVRSGFRDLQDRLGRGRSLKTDLTLCHQLEALQNQLTQYKKRKTQDASNESLSECSFLTRKFKWFAHFKVEIPPPFKQSEIFEDLKTQLQDKKLEFLTLVDASSSKRNADLTLEFDPIYSETTPWYLAQKKADHIWVNYGNLLRPRWKQVAVQYQFYERSRKLYLPYRLHLVDLKTGRQKVMIEEQLEVSALIKASEFRGPRALLNQQAVQDSGYPLTGRNQSLPRAIEMALNNQSWMIGQIIKRMNHVFN